MSIENRIQKMEELTNPKGDTWIAFIYTTCVAGNRPGNLLICKRDSSIQFESKKDFLSWANENGLGAKKIEEICSKLNWD